jgi:predicted transposase YdaD
MSGDHDLGYKQLFAYPELVRDLLAGFTPFACFRDLGPSAFERINASYVSEQFSERHGDMVWRVRIADQVVYVYLLLEFQSHAERWMALRIQVYVGLLYQDLVKRHELGPDSRLPPVLPLVFYNGDSPWNASCELNQLVAPGPSGLDVFQASQRYLLIDQHDLDPADLASARNLVAALFRIELTGSSRVLTEVMAKLGVWLSGEDRAPLRRSILNWIARLLKREGGDTLLPEVQYLLEGGMMGERFQRKYATWADELKDEGRQEGREEGREEGRLLTLRSTLKRLLTKRFGALPADAAERIDHAAEADVQRWMDRVVDAASAEAVLT